MCKNDEAQQNEYFETCGREWNNALMKKFHIQHKDSIIMETAKTGEVPKLLRVPSMNSLIFTAGMQQKVGPLVFLQFLKQEPIEHVFCIPAIFKIEPIEHVFIQKPLG